jgi:hypothetical protein
MDSEPGNPVQHEPTVENKLDSAYLHLFFYIFVTTLYLLVLILSPIGKPVINLLINCVSLADKSGLGFVPLLTWIITVLLTFLVRFSSLMRLIISEFWNRFCKISPLDRLGVVTGITTVCFTILWCLFAENPLEPLTIVFGGITIWIKTTTNFFEKDLPKEGEGNGG